MFFRLGLCGSQKTNTLLAKTKCSSAAKTLARGARCHKQLHLKPLGFLIVCGQNYKTLSVVTLVTLVTLVALVFVSGKHH